MKKEPKTYCLFDSWNRAYNNGQEHCVFTPHFCPDEDVLEMLKETRGEDYDPNKSENIDWEQNDEEWWGALKDFDRTFSDWCIPNEPYQYPRPRGKFEGYLLTGNLGRWNGTPRIYPMFFYSLYDAIQKCWSDELRVDITDGVITCYGYHHDGTNEFQIQAISRKSLTENQEEELLQCGDGGIMDEEVYEKLFVNNKRHLRKIDLFKHCGIPVEQLTPINHLKKAG